MNVVGTIITIFLLALSYGTQLLSPVVSTRLTGVGFYKLGNSIVLASMTLAFASMVTLMKFEVSQFGIVCMSILMVSNIVVPVRFPIDYFQHIYI
jgi:hypothetical protein